MEQPSQQSVFPDMSELNGTAYRSRFHNRNLSINTIRLAALPEGEPHDPGMLDSHTDHLSTPDMRGFSAEPNSSPKKGEGYRSPNPRSGDLSPSVHRSFNKLTLKTPPPIPFSPNSPIGSPKKPLARVAIACLECKKAKVKCDDQRPCSRCTKKGKAHLCIDPIHKKRGKKRHSLSREDSGDLSESVQSPVKTPKFGSNGRRLSFRNDSFASVYSAKLFDTFRHELANRSNEVDHSPAKWLSEQLKHFEGRAAYQGNVQRSFMKHMKSYTHVPSPIMLISFAPLPLHPNSSVWANDALLQRLGLTRADADVFARNGGGLLKLYHACNFKDEVPALVEALCRHKMNYNGRARFWARDGSVLEAVQNAIIAYAEDGRPSHLVLWLSGFTPCENPPSVKNFFGEL